MVRRVPPQPDTEGGAVEGPGLQGAQTASWRWGRETPALPSGSGSAQPLALPTHQPVSHPSSLLPVSRTTSAPHESHLVFLK